MKKLDKKWAQRTVGHRNKDWKKTLYGYSTPKVATLALIKREKLSPNIWEPAAGLLAITKVLRRKGFQVYTSDVKRWVTNVNLKKDFRNFQRIPKPFRASGCDIVTNPPFKLAQEFVENSLRLLPKGNKLCLLLRIQFLEGRKRREMFKEHPLYKVYVFSYRLPRMHLFHYEGIKGSSILCFAWFVWIKGYKGPTTLEWI